MKETKEIIATRIVMDMGEIVLPKKAIMKKYKVGFITATEVYFQLGIEAKTTKDLSDSKRNETGEHNPYFWPLYRPNNKNYLSIAWV